MDLQRAEEFCRSYAAASLDGDATAVAGHYGFPFTAFTLGNVSTFTDREDANRNVAGHLEKLVRTGVGTEIRLDRSDIVPVSDQSALCHLTWSITPASGVEPWSWTNVYALREVADGSMYFEASIADNEILEIMKRYPDFFTL
jgi:hypothetical protein